MDTPFLPYPGALLKKGSNGESVQQIQSALHITVDGIFGPQTERAVKQYQATHEDAYGHPLVIDGQVGALTWFSLFGGSFNYQVDSEFVKVLLKIASSQEGVKETGNNSGHQVNEYLQSIGLGPGYEWCMAFVYWCFEQAAKKLFRDNPALKNGSCSAVYRWAKKKGKLVSIPKPGDIFLVRGGSTGHLHTGIVTGVGAGYIETIEGNTNKGGSSRGLYVMKRERKINSCDFARVV